MTVKTVTLEGWQRALLALNPELRRKTIRGLRGAARVLQAEVVQQIHAVGAVNLGELAKSVSVTTVEDGAEVTVDAPHAAPIEEGTRPFRPPLRPLMLWALRKFSLDEGEAWRVARAVAAQIEKEGIAPRYYFATALEEAAGEMRDEIAREVAGP